MKSLKQSAECLLLVSNFWPVYESGCIQTFINNHKGCFVLLENCRDFDFPMVHGLCELGYNEYRYESSIDIRYLPVEDKWIRLSAYISSMGVEVVCFSIDHEFELSVINSLESTMLVDKRYAKEEIFKNRCGKEPTDEQKSEGDTEYKVVVNYDRLPDGSRKDI